MDLKRSKYRSLILAFLMPLCAASQPADAVETDIRFAEDSTEAFDPSYHFSREETKRETEKTLEPVLDSIYWKELTSGQNFSETEDSSNRARRKKGNPKRNSLHLSDSYKYLWLLPVLLILVLQIYRLVPSLRRRLNPSVKKEMDYRVMPEEEELRGMDTGKALSEALEAGDYQHAFRIGYLDILRELTERNLIRYRKDRTNRQYLSELRGQPLYEPFRELTAHFEGIWYGDRETGKAYYDSLQPLFEELRRILKAL